MKRLTTIFIVAATYVGTVVGAGFATGKEIVTFFSVNGVLGTIGIVCSGILFIVVGTKIMVISARIQAYSYQEFNQYLFGRKIGNIINIFIFIIVVGITSVLLSGAGAVFQEQLGLPFQLGIVSTLIISYIVLLKGLKGIFAINAYIVPVMIIFSLFIAVAIYSSYPHVLLDQAIPDGLSKNFSWMVSPFTYAAFNLMTAQVVLVPLGKEIKDEGVLHLGGFLGGIVLFVILLANHFSMSAFPGSFAFEIPMAEIVKGFGTFIHGFFLVVIVGEIFNSVVGNVFGVTRQLQSALNLRYHHAILLILFVIFLVSQVGYGKLLSVLYPLFGYIGLLFLVCIVIKKSPAR